MKNNQLDFLWDMSKSLSDSYDAEKIVCAIQLCLKKYIDCDKAEVLIWDKNTNSVKNFSKNWILINSETQDYYLHQILDTFEILKNAIIYNDTVYSLVTGEKTNLTIKKLKNNNAIKIYLPLIRKESVFGFVELDVSQEKEKISPELLKMFGILLYQLSSSILNNILNNQMQVNVNFHAAMKNIAKIIESQYELSYIIPLIGEMIDRFVSSHLIYIFLYNEKTGFSLLWPNACHEKHIIELLKSINKNSEHIITDDKKTGIFPLIQEKNLIGAIVAYSNIDVLSDNDIQYLQQLSGQSSITIQRASVYGEILKHATLDALTGLNNRRQFDVRLGQEVSTAKRKKKPLCCIMIDVDYFKKVNDTYGHIAGDCVLKQVGKIIPQELREYDIAARYGGEEFAILLPYTSIQEAFSVAQRLRKAIEENEMDISEARIPDIKTIKVTASFGVSEYIDTIKDPTELYKMADSALYEAKERGRNKVIVYSPQK